MRPIRSSIASTGRPLDLRPWAWRARWQSCLPWSYWCSDGRSSSCCGDGRAMRKLLLAAIGVVMVAPFLYMISVSFMGEGELLRWPPPFLPAAPTTGNYAAALEALPYTRVLLNTAILAGCVMIAQVLTSAAAGYAFARMRFPGRDGIWTTMLAMLALPAILLLIPRYLMIDALGWVDTYPGLISTELVSVWSIFLMRQAFVM